MQAAVQTTAPPGSNLQDVFPSWISTLEKSAIRLHGISGSSESEFLAIGSQLHDFYSRATAILEMSNEALRLVAGDDVLHAFKGLQEIMRMMNDYVGRAEEEAGGGVSNFSSILSQLDTVSQPLAGFKKINKSLSMLGISTKIESARLGQSAAGFDTLANDVSKLSVQVIEKSDTIMGQKEQLAELIRQTLSQLVSSAGVQTQTTRTILDKTSDSLEILNDVNARCSSAASVISGVSADVARNIGEVVTSLQFHDISRQQIEHVEETLHELISRLQGGDLNPRDLIQDVGDLCELQAAQLQHARDEITGAVQSIISNLRAISCQESHLSDETRGIAGVADKASGSFFTDMEGDLSVVSDALGHSAEENRNISNAMNRVAGTVGNIARFVTDIETIGEEIELIALNAQIKAARTGSEGAALGVLAEAIQRLSHDTRIHTTVVSDALRSITDFIEGFCRGTDKDVADMEAEVRGMVADLKQLLQALREVSTNLVSLLERMNREVAELSSDIEAAIGGITVHEALGNELFQVIGILKEVIAGAREIVPAAAGKEQSERMGKIAERYTMHSERKIHASFSGAGAGRNGLAVPAAENAEDGLGDNVELF